MSDDREWKLTDKKLKPAPASVEWADLWMGLVMLTLGFVLGRCSYHLDVRFYP